MKTRILAMNQHPRNGYRHNIVATSTIELTPTQLFLLAHSLLSCFVENGLRFCLVQVDAKNAWGKFEGMVEGQEELKKKMEKNDFLREDAERELNKVSQKVESSERVASEALAEMEMWKNKLMENKKTLKKLNERVVELQGNIRVFCRLRPLSQLEQSELDADPEAADMRQVIQYLDDDKMLFHGAMYEYDFVFPPETQQEDVFLEVSERCGGGGVEEDEPASEAS